MAGDALASREFASITGPAGEGVLITFPPDPRKRPTAAAIVKKFKDKGIDPEGYVLYTYAAFQAWAQAAAKAGTTDPQKVAAAMRGGTEHGARTHLLRQQGRHHRRVAGPSIAGTKTAITTRSQARRGGVESAFPGRGAAR